MNIYLIKENFRIIEETLFESGGEVTPEVAQALELHEENLSEVTSNLFKLLQEKDIEVAGLDVKIEELQKAKSKREKVIATIKKYLVSAVETFGPLECEDRKLKIQAYEKIEIEDESLIDKKYLAEKITYKPDKKKIKEDIKSGIGVTGAELIKSNHLKIL